MSTTTSWRFTEERWAYGRCEEHPVGTGSCSTCGRWKQTVQVECVEIGDDGEPRRKSRRLCADCIAACVQMVEKVRALLPALPEKE